LDISSYICIPEVLKWYREAAGREEVIRSYYQILVYIGSKKIIEILGTEIMDNKEGILIQYYIVNIRLPLKVLYPEKYKIEPGEYTIKPEYNIEATDWILDILINEFKTFITIYYFQNI
jgi:hercynylcysteine S-oxide lyase